jgi:Flp pilus assembly protein protease CpaA
MFLYWILGGVFFVVVWLLVRNRKQAFFNKYMGKFWKGKQSIGYANGILYLGKEGEVLLYSLNFLQYTYFTT